MTYIIAHLLPGHLALFVSIRNVLLSYERHNDALFTTSLHFRLLWSYVVLSTVSSGTVLTDVSCKSGINVFNPEEASSKFRTLI